MTRQTTIVGLGEALFDLLPSGRVLGGAPLNVAHHTNQLLRPNGGRGVVASRIGSDLLGAELLTELEKRGLTDDYVQRDSVHPTGTVNVTLDRGQPSYEIVTGVAWDHFDFTPAWAELAGDCAAVVFGTLAQRSEPSREAIWQFLDAAPQAARMLDVNLRQQFYDRTVLEESCRRATLVKLNEDELPVVADLMGLTSTASDARLAELRAKYALEGIVYTRGKQGTLLVLENELVDAPPASYPVAPQADAVGAGDACSAAILVGWVRRLAPEQIGRLANRLGAYVASQSGATPELPQKLVELAG